VLPPTPIQRARAWAAVQWNRLDDEPKKEAAA